MGKRAYSGMVICYHKCEMNRHSLFGRSGGFPVPLTAKQAMFVREYLTDMNGTQAAIRAGYSARTANEQGARLLAKASIREAIEKAQAERLQRLDIDADYV